MPMHPRPRAETLRPLFPRSLRGKGAWVGTDVALIACSRVRVSLAAQVADVQPCNCSIRSSVLEATEPLAIRRSLYRDGSLCSPKILVGPGNSRGRLKPGRKVPGALRDSSVLAQNVAQPAGELLTGTP